MLEENHEDNQYEDINFDTPPVHTPPRLDENKGEDSQRVPYHHGRSQSLTDKEIHRARRSHSNEMEQRIELLRYIAAKEKIIADLHEQLQAHEIELWLLKEKWTQIVTQSSYPTPNGSKNNEEMYVPPPQPLDEQKQNIPRTNSSPSLISSVYQRLRDTLENVAQTERTRQTITTLRSALEQTYQFMSAPIIIEDELHDNSNHSVALDYFSALPVPSAAAVFGRSPMFVTSSWSQGSTISVVPPRLKKPEPVRSMTS